MKSMQSTKNAFLFSILMIPAIFCSKAQAKSLSQCMSDFDVGYRKVLTLMSPSSWPSTMLNCILTDGNAEVAERLIRQEAAAAHFNPSEERLPYLTAYAAFREHALALPGKPSPEIADEVLRSAPGTIAQLLKKEATRLSEEREAASK